MTDTIESLRNAIITIDDYGESPIEKSELEAILSELSKLRSENSNLKTTNMVLRGQTDNLIAQNSTLRAENEKLKSSISSQSRPVEKDYDMGDGTNIMWDVIADLRKIMGDKN